MDKLYLKKAIMSVEITERDKDIFKTIYKYRYLSIQWRASTKIRFLIAGFRLM